MYLLRRTAARAISSTPSKAIFAKPRSITTYTPAFRSVKQQWIVPSLQRRWASDDAEKPVESAEAAAAEAENFAQTRPEAPIEENLTPAQQAAQADPTDASRTAGADALEAVFQGKREGSLRKGGRDGNFPVEPVEPGKVLYVGNLYYEVNEDQLKRIFSRFGAIDSIKIVRDNRNLSRGFGYVEFQTIDDARAAVDNLDMQVFEGRNLVVQYHRQKANSPRRSSGGSSNYAVNEPSKTLFVGNMSFEMSDKDLNDLFRGIRNVMDVRVAIDRRTGQPRGFAHADFIDVASAQQAKEVLEQKVIYGRQLRIDYSKSGPEASKTDSVREDTVSSL